MCLLAIFFRVVDDAPLIAGANREEAYARGGEPPRPLTGPVRAIAGVDPVAGGTWFGVNERGVLVAVTNRSKSQLPNRPRSRGLLARDLLASTSARQAAEQAAHQLEEGRYAGCNVACADAEGVSIVHAGDWLRIRPLPPGIHVLTARDVDDEGDPRLAYALWWLGQRQYASGGECVKALQELCAQTGNAAPPICIRGEKGGTVSSSIVALRQPLSRSVYLHAQGPPDRTPFASYSHLFEELAGRRHNGP
jgi:uncharacterized protein with NRDE domain